MKEIGRPDDRSSRRETNMQRMPFDLPIRNTMSEFEEEELTIANSDCVTQYKTAAEIANKALAAVVEATKSGAKVVDLCVLGDKIVTDECAKVFKSKDLEKGIAFPTCVSINSVIGHFSPLADDTTTVAAGDVVKIDLGCHINGMIATVATTICADESTVTGRKADVIAAASQCFEAALRCIRPGKKGSDVAPVLGRVAEAYGCSVVEGVMTHMVKQYLIDGPKCVLNRPSVEQKVEDCEFEENEVYVVDIVVSTGEGKSRVVDEKATTVYKRNYEEYQLKMKNSRAVFAEVSRKFPAMPFSIRALESPNVRFGVVECVNHGLLQPYPVLHEKAGEFVAQIKGTVLLTKNGSDRITQHKLPTLQSDKKIDDPEVLALLKESLKNKKVKAVKA